MELQDIQAELSVRTIEFEQALHNNLPHSELIKIYKKLKELQYQRLMIEIRQRVMAPSQVIE